MNTAVLIVGLVVGGAAFVVLGIFGFVYALARMEANVKQQKMLNESLYGSPQQYDELRAQVDLLRKDIAEVKQLLQWQFSAGANAQPLPPQTEAEATKTKLTQ